jgi:hypothetical protein
MGKQSILKYIAAHSMTSCVLNMPFFSLKNSRKKQQAFGRSSKIFELLANIFALFFSAFGWIDWIWNLVVDIDMEMEWKRCMGQCNVF